MIDAAGVVVWVAVALALQDALLDLIGAVLHRLFYAALGLVDALLIHRDWMRGTLVLHQVSAWLLVLDQMARGIFLVELNCYELIFNKYILVEEMSPPLSRRGLCPPGGHLAPHSGVDQTAPGR